jgi:hypothetical protein
MVEDRGQKSGFSGRRPQIIPPKAGQSQETIAIVPAAALLSCGCLAGEGLIPKFSMVTISLSSMSIRY